jgi:hypothetical protein
MSFLVRKQGRLRSLRSMDLGGPFWAPEASRPSVRQASAIGELAEVVQRDDLLRVESQAGSRPAVDGSSNQLSGSLPPTAPSSRGNQCVLLSRHLAATCRRRPKSGIEPRWHRVESAAPVIRCDRE